MASHFCQSNGDPAADSRYAQERVGEDAYIHPEAGGFDVFQIENQLLANALQIGVGREVDLGKSRDTGTNRKPLQISRNLLGQHMHEFGALGPRTNQRHFPLKHIEQLGELIQMQFSQHITDKRGAIVAKLGPHGPVGLRVQLHGSNFIHDERPAVLPDTGLTVDSRPARSQANQQHEQSNKRQCGDQENQGQDPPEPTLPPAVGCRVDFVRRSVIALGSVRPSREGSQSLTRLLWF